MHELGLNAAHLQRNDRRYVLKAPHQMICLMRNMDNGLHGGFASSAEKWTGEPPSAPQQESATALAESICRGGTLCDRDTVPDQ